MTTDTSERGLERLICTALTGHPCNPPRDDVEKTWRPQRDSNPCRHLERVVS